MAMLLTIVYPMQGLFSGNQNIYFLWGMADMFPNAFTADPLLSSPDPYPLFSWSISIFPAQFLPIWTTLLYVLLTSIYSFSLFGIADKVAGIYRNRSRLFSFSAVFLFLHASPIWGTYFQLVFDIDLRWMWDSGIAEQGVLRGYLQPSVFGVFLLLSFYFAARRNFAAAILCIAPAAIMHANYLFLGGMLSFVYLIQAGFERKTIIASCLLLLAVLPYSNYLLKHFLLLDADTKMAIDKAVMAGFDHNLHINPMNWINAKLFAQLVVLFLGFVVVWKTSVRNLVLGLSGIAMALTSLAFATDNTTLISLNPWRISILLIPLFASVLTAKIISSGIWKLLQPIAFATIGSICMMLVYYRLFGNSSDDFQHRWMMIHLALTLGTVTVAILLSKKEWFCKLVEPLLVVAFVVVGVTDIFIENRSKADSDQFRAIALLEGIEPNTIYIIPSEWTSFRMNAQKAVFADENLVYGPALPGLMERLELLGSENHAQIIGSISTPTTIKIIVPRSSQFANIHSTRSLTENYTCFVLRQ